MTLNTGSSISSIMQNEVLTVEDDWPLNRLARFLTDHQISGAPVTDRNGELVGVVSLTDIVRHDGMPESQARDHGMHEYYLHTLEMQVAQEEASDFHIQEETSTTVREIMTPMIFQVDENGTIQEAADTMVKGHIHRLFVTNGKRISGIVTALDILKVVRDSQPGNSDAGSM